MISSPGRPDGAVATTANLNIPPDFNRKLDACVTGAGVGFAFALAFMVGDVLVRIVPVEHPNLVRVLGTAVFWLPFWSAWRAIFRRVGLLSR